MDYCILVALAFDVTSLCKPERLLRCTLLSRTDTLFLHRVIHKMTDALAAKSPARRMLTVGPDDFAAVSSVGDAAIAAVS